MSLSFKLFEKSARGIIVLGVMLLTVTPIALAQTTSWATLDAPPTEIAPREMFFVLAIWAAKFPTSRNTFISITI